MPRFYREFLSWEVIAVVLAINLGTFIACGFYNRWWRYVSTRDMWGVARGVTIGTLLSYVVLLAFPPEGTSTLPRGVVAIYLLLLLALVAGVRASILGPSVHVRPQVGAESLRWLCRPRRTGGTGRGRERSAPRR